MTDAPAVERGDAEPTELGSVGATALPRRRRRFARYIAAAVALLLALLVLLLAWGLAQPRLQADDPAATNPTGSAAVAQLLRNHGLQLSVQRSARPAAFTEKTLIVTDGDRLTSSDWDAVARSKPARIVFVGAIPQWVDGLAYALPGSPATADPGCSDSYAARAGAVVVRSQIGALAKPGDLQACYRTDKGAGYLATTRGGVPVYALGAIAENQDLGHEGNAALALGVMGATSQAVWFVAEPPRAASDEDRPNFLPPWAAWAALMLLATGAVVAVWQGRRFGPILSERLPVVVRASETVEGHGRLYQRLGARDTAAATLRRATIARLERRYGSSDPARIAELVSTSTGLDAQRLASALGGPVPATDRDLIVLKQTLDDIERKASGS